MTGKKRHRAQSSLSRNTHIHTHDVVYLSDAEVAQFRHVIPRQENVLRFDVTVQNLLGVNKLQRGSDLRGTRAVTVYTSTSVACLSSHRNCSLSNCSEREQAHQCA